jgi:hypothetical protein
MKNPERRATEIEKKGNSIQLKAGGAGDSKAFRRKYLNMVVT